ncbi:hypothetical protein [Massilia sp. METH4]|uniref:hypothetical protein n=1 Tax=Massilia sp. METH4 TaxID=3123041 RepID=UPI0030D2835C
MAKLEADLTAIKLDVAVIKANGAAKSDIAELKAATKADIAELKSTTKTDIAELKVAIADSQAKIIMWVVVAIFLAQLLPLLKDFIKPADPAPAATQSTATPASQEGPWTQYQKQPAPPAAK